MAIPAKQLIIYEILTNKSILCVFGTYFALSAESSTCTQVTTTEKRESS
jgi:hypothetical protein